MASELATRDAIDRMLAARKSPLVGHADYMIVLARYHGIAITLSLGIAGAETGFATDPNMSPADLPGHNAWGYGHPPGATHGWQFPSWPDGIAAVTQWLAEHYVHAGLDTVEKIAPVWVGSPAPDWVANVSDVMRQFGGDPNKLARAPLAKAP